MGEGRRGHSGREFTARRGWGLGAGGCELRAASQRGPLGAREAKMPMPRAGSWEPKEGGRDQLEQKPRVRAGAAKRGGRRPGWLLAHCRLHLRVTLGRSPPLSARQPPSLPLSLRSGASSTFRGLGLGLLQALLASLGLPTFILHGALVVNPFPLHCTPECECLEILKVHKVLPVLRKPPSRPPEQAAPASTSPKTFAMGEGRCSSPKELDMKKLIYFLKSNSSLPCCS